MFTLPKFSVGIFGKSLRTFNILENKEEKKLKSVRFFNMSLNTNKR